MTISGLVVKTAPEHVDRVIEALSASGFGEVHFHDRTGRVVVTVEGGDAGEEARKMEGIRNLPDVLCVDLAYSCSEKGAWWDGNRLERTRDAVPDALKSSLPDE